MRKGRPVPLGEVLGELLRRPAIRRGLKKGRVLALWPRVVGPELARLTRPFRLTGGTLWVAVRDHLLAHQLTYQRGLLLARYAHELGAGTVREIRFVVAPDLRPEPPRREPPHEPPPPLDPAAEGWLLQTIRPLPEGLRRPALGLGRAVLGALAAAPRCPVCRGPSPEGGPCPSCRMRMALPAVAREAERLLAGAPPRLEGDLLAAARYRAEAQARARLEALAPRAAAEPGRVPELLDAALALLRVRLGREPSPADLEDLPPAVAGLLRRHLGDRS